MKSILLALALTIPTSALRAEDTVTIIKQEATKCAQAVVRSNYDAVVRYTHPRIVKALGGKDAMIAVIKNAMSQMHANGIQLVDVTIGQPEVPKKIATWMTSIVGQRLVMKVPGGRLVSDSTLLGISEDDGKIWVFVDLGPVTREQFAQIFPELDGKITIPEKKPPQFTKDE